MMESFDTRIAAVLLLVYVLLILIVLILYVYEMFLSAFLKVVGKKKYAVEPEYITVKGIVDYMDEHVSIFEKDEKTGKKIVCEILHMLKVMPNYDIVMKGSLHLANYESEESEIFYIPYMMLFFELLRDGDYFGFIHYFSNFLHYKILQDGKREIRYLPSNIKTALIYTMERGLH